MPADFHFRLIEQTGHTSEVSAGGTGGSCLLLTVKQGHLRLDGGSLHQGAHHHRQILLELLPQNLAHSRPG